jgi:hypothetical protein
MFPIVLKSGEVGKVIWGHVWGVGGLKCQWNVVLVLAKNCCTDWIECAGALLG